MDPKLGDVPVDFLSSVDTTGGNSGSAVLNARGELVGLLFDGTWETIASDFLFDVESTRSIQVDSRYLLWFLTDVAKASNLLQELRRPCKQSPPFAAATDPLRIASLLLPHIPCGYAQSSRLALLASRPPGSVRGLIHDL